MGRGGCEWKEGVVKVDTREESDGDDGFDFDDVALLVLGANALMPSSDVRAPTTVRIAVGCNMMACAHEDEGVVCDTVDG